MISKGKRVRIIVLIFCLAILIFVIVKLVVAIIETNRSFEEDLPVSYSLTSEDSLLIKDIYRQKIKVNVVHNSKVRGPVSMLFFDQSYHLIIYKIHLLSGNLPLQNILQTQIRNADRSVGYPYTIYTDNINFKFQCKAGLVSSVSKVYLTVSGDSLRTIAKNDSIIAYNLDCKNLSIRYQDQGPVDIFVVGNEKFLSGTNAIPMDILFLKRDDNLYFLLLTPRNEKGILPRELLYNVID